MENHHLSWENPLFQWPCSIAFCMFTRGYKSSLHPFFWALIIHQTIPWFKSELPGWTTVVHPPGDHQQITELDLVVTGMSKTSNWTVFLWKSTVRIVSTKAWHQKKCSLKKSHPLIVAVPIKTNTNHVFFLTGIFKTSKLWSSWQVGRFDNCPR